MNFAPGHECDSRNYGLRQMFSNRSCTIVVLAYRGYGGLGDESEDHLPANRSVSRLLFCRICTAIPGFDLVVPLVIAILQFAHLDGQRLNYDESAR